MKEEPAMTAESNETGEVNSMQNKNFTHCTKCGTVKTNGAECQKCGAIYEKAEAAHIKYLADMEKEHAEILAEQAKKEEERLRKEKLAQEALEQERKIAEINSQFKLTGKPEVKQNGYQVDCHACKLVDGMKPARTRRFSGMVVVAGSIIVIPSVIGMLLSVLFVFLPFGSDANLLGRLAMGAASFCFSCVIGTVGWLLLSTRSVFLCRRCGYVLERFQE